MIGPGRPIDTDKLFVICPNLLGGCRGTTGPSSDDPSGNSLWVGLPAAGDRRPRRGAPAVAVAPGDRAAAHRDRRLDGRHAGAAVADRRDRAQIERAVMVCASPRLTAQNLALSHVARRAILDDPDFHDGQYLRHGTRPARGLATARRLAHVTYLSEEGMAAQVRPRRAGGLGARRATRATWLAPRLRRRDLPGAPGRRSSSSASTRCSYLYLTRIMDAFDPFDNGAGPIALRSRDARAGGRPSAPTGASAPSTRARWPAGPAQGAGCTPSRSTWSPRRGATTRSCSTCPSTSTG